MMPREPQNSGGSDNRSIGVVWLVLRISKAVCGGEGVSVFFVCECGLVEGLGAFKVQARP